MGKKKSKSTKKKPAAAQRELPLEKLRTEEDFLKYMKLLKLFAKKYCVMIVANDTPVGPDTTREMTGALLEMGLRIDLYEKYRCAYAALIDAGRVVFEEIKSDKVEAKIIAGQSEVELVSVGFNVGTRRGLIRIDGENRSINRRGLNIVVYDKTAGAVLDAASFDTFEEAAPRFLVNTDAQILKKFAEAHPNVSVICTLFPGLPADPLTPGERFITENQVTSSVIRSNLHRHIFALNKYFDEAEIAELLCDLPKSYLDSNGIRRFEDRQGKLVNTSGGHRETAYQPEQFQRTIFLFGGCTVFGLGSDDSRTVASYLQARYNSDVPEMGIIVQNYGYFLIGEERNIEGNSKILNALPIKPMDIVIYQLQSRLPGSVEFPCIDLSQAAEQPRDYEVFYDIDHYTPDGNRLIAERLFKGLVDLGVLRQSKTVSSDRPGSDLRNTRDFAGYLRLLKKYAQKYCVAVSSWEAAGGPGFTEEIFGLYREVGFQADLIEKPNCAYAAVIDAGELVYEEQCEDVAQCIDVTLTDDDFKFEANIVSKGPGSEPFEKGPIEINGNNCSSKSRGLHFAVYDKAEQAVIDAVNFDISLDPASCYRRPEYIPDKVLPDGSTLMSAAGKTDAAAPAAVYQPAAKTADLPFEADTYKELAEYKKALTDWYDQTFSMTIGSVVMNCNPFTLGHRFLVEQALKQCDFLIVFVVQEDKSRFPFEDRLRLVKEGVADLKNVAVFPSGKFVLSSLTFSEYFNKSELQDRTIDTSLDVTVFAREIAPCLHITKRFAGEEPFDAVTRQYNETMRRVLPEYGIEFVVFPRKTDARGEGAVISASRVRELLGKGDFEAIRSLVPESTYRYLKGL